MVGSGFAGLPEFVQLAGQAAGGADHSGGRTEDTVHSADHLGLGWAFDIARDHHALGVVEPFCTAAGSVLRPIAPA